MRCRDRDHPVQRGPGVDGLADGAGDQLVQRRTAPRQLEVDRSAMTVGHGGASGAPRGLEHHLAGEVCDRVVVAVGLVELEHRELRRVRGVHALVAEDAADLEDPVDPADHEPLEVELQRDAQRHVEVERVEVRRERSCSRASVHRLQHRGLDLDEVVGVQHVAHRAHDRGPVADHAPAVGVDDQVDVAPADPQLRVGEAVVLVGQWTQRLAGQHPLLREHAELAATAADDLAGDADVVAEVNVGLPLGQPLLADAVQADHHLQLGVTLLQRREAQLAAGAAEDHATGDAHDLAGGGVDLEVDVPPAHLGQRRRAGGTQRVGRGAARQQPVVLLAPHAHLLRKVVLSRGRRGRGHARQPSEAAGAPQARRAMTSR